MSKVAVIMGSDSDYNTLVPAIKLLKEYGVTVDVNVMSAVSYTHLAGLQRMGKKDFVKFSN